MGITFLVITQEEAIWGLLYISSCMQSGDSSMAGVRWRCLLSVGASLVSAAFNRLMAQYIVNS